MNPDTLARNLREWSVAYYRGIPQVDDATWESARAQLKKLDPSHPVLREVGTVPCNTLKKVKHAALCGSLDNTFDAQGIQGWVERVNRLNGKDIKTVAIQDKLDGLSLVLTYEKGLLVQGATRGDGIEGEDVTANVIRMPSVPFSLTDTFTGEIRGECVVTKKMFEKYFKPRGDANPRNSAAGTIRKQSGELADKLKFIAYEIVPSSTCEISLATENDVILALSEFGFIAAPTQYIQCTAPAIQKAWEESLVKRPTLPYDVDGMVVKVNFRGIRDRLGVIDGCPRGALACKWRGEMVAETTVVGLENSVGRTGVITPVAILKPVVCGGVTISRASLFNWDEIKKLPGIGIGARVKVERAGDVIPTVRRIVSPSETPFTRPENCPSCQCETFENGPKQVCCNPACPAQSFRTVMNWVKGRNILNLGESTVDALMALDGPVEEIDNLYTLDVEQIAKATGSQLTANKILASLDKSKTCTMAQLFGNIGIPGIGETEAEKAIAATGCTSPEEMVETVERLTFEDVLGPVTGKKFVNGVKKRRSMIQRLSEHLIIQVPAKGATDGEWAGKTFCASGPSTLPRESLKSIIVKAGGIWKSSVVNGLDYLIVAEPDLNTGKMQEARKKNVTVISETKALDMAGYK